MDNFKVQSSRDTLTMAATHAATPRQLLACEIVAMYTSLIPATRCKVPCCPVSSTPATGNEHSSNKPIKDELRKQECAASTSEHDKVLTRESS